MATELEPLQWLKRLQDGHQKSIDGLKKFNAHYEGTQPLAYLHPELLAEMGERLQQVVINWPQLVVNRLEDRQDIRGFRIAGSAKADAGLAEIWQYNDLDELHHEAHIDAYVMGRSYAIIGPKTEDGPPRITVESPLECFAEFDPATRQERAAYKPWVDDIGPEPAKHASLYLPNGSYWFVEQDGEWVLDPEHGPDEHNLGEVPVVTLVNRPRTHRPGVGRSELADITPVSDMANKIATDMGVSAEFHAMPRRWALGITPEDFVDEQGRRMSVWSKIAGRIWASQKTKDQAEVGQFPEANLENFHKTINLLAQLVSGLAGLPQSYLGLHTENPPSADSIKAQEAPLVKRAERSNVNLGGRWERVMRIADRRNSNDGPTNEKLRRLETIWSDPSTPTLAQSTDAAVKKYQAKITPLRQTREDCGYNDEQIKLMEAEDTVDAAKNPQLAIARAFGGDGQPATVAPVTPPAPAPADAAA